MSRVAAWGLITAFGFLIGLGFTDIIGWAFQ